MDNYEVLEVIHASRTSETIILKVKEKNKRICDKVYALKLIGSLNNRFQKLIFKREVDALKTLNSCDNIVKIRDYMLNAEFRGKNDWGLILLDYVDGTNLEELDLSNFSQVEKYELCLKILKAIEEAHNYNVLHRDIKPSNIMYNIETGEVKIIDFGTSKIKSIVEQETTLPFYSPNFSAPEVVKGNSTTEASDIYSLGAVIFYILFGMLPNGTEMICRTLQDLEVPENLGILIAKMVAEEPENRFQEVGTVIDAFEEIIGDNSSQKDTYLCSIDVDKLRYLKNVSLIEANTNMTIFTKSFLKSQFKECSAFYNHNTDVYIFSGKKIAVECIYNEKDELFVVNRIMPLSVDRRISNQKRGFIIDGIVKFIESGRGNYSSRRLDSQVFYEGKIATEVDDKNRMHPIKKFAGKSIIWIDTSMMDRKDESRLKGGSYCNYAENTLVKKLLEGFKNEGVLPNLDIGIITGYRGQKDLIRKSVNNSGYDRIAKGIDINTLDAFQGRENDIIIYSTVRTKNSIGFQKEKERVNVAFSRAKNLLIICGDMDFFYKFDDPDNKFIEIIDYICEHEDECLVIPGGEI